MKAAVLNIQGMSCGHCLNAVSAAMRNLQGVRVESVRMGRADISYDETMLPLQQIKEAVEAAGYSVATVMES